jgi:hypothetical protein
MAMGTVCDDKGDATGALGYYHQALGLQQELDGPKHLSVGLTLSNTGVAYYRSKFFDQAADHFGQALSILAAELGATHPHTRNTSAWWELTAWRCAFRA